MPKQTWLNLPVAKRDRFVAVALVEFASKPYDRASISAIVAELGIAKGSVYQYFDNKLDLFQWLLHEAGRRKMAALATRQPCPRDDFWERLSQMYGSGLIFWRQEPLWSRLGLRAMEPSKDPKLEVLRMAYRAGGHAFLRDQLAAAQTDGSVRLDVDVELAAWLVHGLLTAGLTNAFMAAAGADLGEIMANPGLAADVQDKDLQNVVDTAIDLLRRGLGPSAGA